MKLVMNLSFVIMSLAGAYVGSIIAGDVPVMPRYHNAQAPSHDVKIVRFSKRYACQKSDHACIANGMEKFNSIGTPSALD